MKYIQISDGPKGISTETESFGRKRAQPEPKSNVVDYKFISLPAKFALKFILVMCSK